MSVPTTPIQMIRIYYRGGTLELLDSDDRTPLYHVKVSSQTPQFRLVPVRTRPLETQDSSTRGASECTAAFKKLSFDVKLSLHGNAVTMRRSHYWSRTYNFKSPSMDRQLAWEADGALTGDFRLIDCSSWIDSVIARFHNKLFSSSEVGSFEVIGNISDETRDELVITGLSELVMMQSLSLAGMVLWS